MIKTKVYSGKTYRLYPGRRYYMNHKNTLHSVVWKESYGNVPEGYHIHHIDEDIENNNLSNLELKPIEKHLADHSRKRWNENKKWANDFQSKGVEAAKQWHKSEAGHEWHKQQALKQGFGTQDYGNGICATCGNEFKKSTAFQKFCHANCKAKDFRKRHK